MAQDQRDLWGDDQPQPGSQSYAESPWPQDGTTVVMQQQQRSYDGHITAIGVLMIVWGGFALLAGLIVLAATGYGGAIGAAESGEEGVFAAAAGAGMLVLFIMLLGGLPSLIAGIGLLQRKPWARILGIVVAALALLNVPFGTAFGIYALVILTKPEVDQAMQQTVVHV